MLVPTRPALTARMKSVLVSTLTREEVRIGRFVVNCRTIAVDLDYVGLVERELERLYTVSFVSFF